MTAPVLDGMRVVDLSVGIPGAYCTKLLADAGADVVKFEPVGGDPLRRRRTGALFEFLNTSKRAGGTDADALIATADIIVASEPIDVARLRDRSPALVVVTITPFGLDGPWVDRVATEFTLQAWCGSTGGRGVPSEPPLAAGGQLGEFLAGTYAALGASAALLGARRTGLGRHVDVAMLDVMAITMVTYPSVWAEFFGWPALSAPPRTLEVPSIEPTADGYVVLTTNSAQQLADSLILIERPDLLDDPNLPLGAYRTSHRDEVLALYRAYTTKHTTDEVLEQASLLRIPCGPVGNGASVDAFDHFVARGVFVKSPTGRFSQPRVPYRMSGAGPRPFTPAPAAGDGAAPVDWEPRTGVEPSASGGSPLPLDGVRIIDCTAWWAGPAAAHVLACLGADVIKVESITRPDLMRYSSSKAPSEDRWWEWGAIYHAANNTKRGITLDLSHPDGVALFRRLAATADVVLENYTPRVMDNFGLDWDALHAVNSRLIMVRMPAFGLDGPWRDRTGFAQTMEAITGIAWLTGWEDGDPTLARGPCDPLAGSHAVLGTILALMARDQSDEGMLVEATMVETALNATAEQIAEYQASGELISRTGNRDPLVAPQGVYRCRDDADWNDNWLALTVATDDQWRALGEILGNPAWADAPALATVAGRLAAHDDIDTHLAEWCATRDVALVAEEFAAGGVPAGVVIASRDVSRNPQLRHRGLFEQVDHPLVGTYETPTLPFRMDGVEHWSRFPAPTLGQHTAEILTQLGVGDAEMARLRDTGIIGERVVGA